MPATSSDIAIVGAGIVGLSVTHALRERGMEVTCFDHGEPGQGQSAGSSRVFRHHVGTPELAALAAIAEHAPDVVFITTPNNPTGDVTSLADIERLVHAAPGVVVVDEAYAEFSPSPSAVTLLEKYPTKLVVSRTMSKAFDFAGGRLGYFVAAPAFIEAVMLVRLPYHLSAVSQATANAALQHYDVLLENVEDIKAQRDRIVDGLRDLGLAPAVSDSNFVFFGGLADSHAVWQGLLEHGVEVADSLLRVVVAVATVVAHLFEMGAAGDVGRWPAVRRRRAGSCR